MNKSQIADRLAGRLGLSRSAAAGAVDAVSISASVAPAFRAGKALKDAVNGR